MKATLFEAGIRSPLVVWAPGFMSKESLGSINKQSVLCAMDLVPSVLTMAGIEQPEDVRFDGHPLSEVFLGKSQASRPDPIFFRRPPDRKDFRNMKDLPDLAMRDGKWKFMCDYDGGRPLLFDLEVDESETNNLAKVHPEVVNAMTNAVVNWNTSMPKDAGDPSYQR